MDFDAIFQQVNLRYMSYMSFCNLNSKLDGRRYDFFFSFKYSCSLSTSKSCAKTPLPDSFECFLDPQRSFGNPLRTFRQYLASPGLFLKNRDFFCYGEIFLPNTRGPLGCLLGFWPSGPKPCGGKYKGIIICAAIYESGLCFFLDGSQNEFDSRCKTFPWCKHLSNSQVM